VNGAGWLAALVWTGNDAGEALPWQPVRTAAGDWRFTHPHLGDWHISHEFLPDLALSDARGATSQASPRTLPAHFA
jgi:hypothetical protein